MTICSFTTSFWTRASSDSWSRKCGRIKIWTRECDQPVLREVHFKIFGYWFEAPFCLYFHLTFRYGFLAVFAATDGGITRVFPNKWVHSSSRPMCLDSSCFVVLIHFSLCSLLKWYAVKFQKTCGIGKAGSVYVRDNYSSGISRFKP